jgi:DNA primase
VYPESNRFICFGCSQQGDAIDFVRQLKNLTFKEAITYLGINGDVKTFQKGTARESQKRALIQSFRKWCDQYYDELAADYRAINKIMRTFRTIEEAENSAALYHRLPELEYQMDIIAFGDDRARFELYNEVKK